MAHARTTLEQAGRMFLVRCIHSHRYIIFLNVILVFKDILQLVYVRTIGYRGTKMKIHKEIHTKQLY